MNNMQMIILTLILALATALTRFLPFLVFGRLEKTPAWIEYLSKVLPAAMMGLLVIYCFKDTNFMNQQETIPALAASAAVVALHLWKRNTILSISLGTAVYMLLIRIL